MYRTRALEYPPSTGYGVADITYYAVFFMAQVIIGMFYLRRWNVSMFLGLWIFLFLEILGSVAFLKLHYAPFTGTWYNLYVFGFTAAPTFFASALHLCVHRAAQTISARQKVLIPIRASSRAYITACLGADLLVLLLTVVGAAYALAKTSSEPETSQPGFDVMTSAMAVQACSLAFTFLGALEVIRSFSKSDHQRPRFFVIFLAGLLLLVIILFARVVIRAVILAGGFEGPLHGLLLVSVETIMMFVAILIITVLHPAVFLRDDRPHATKRHANSDLVRY